MEHSYQGLMDQVLKTFDYVIVEPQRTRMGFGPTTPAGIFLDNIFGARITVYETLLKLHNDPLKRTPVVEAKLKEAKAALEEAYREFYSYCRSRAVTNDDRVAMGMPVYDSTNTPVLKPTSWPLPKLDTSVVRKITVHYIDSVSNSRGKPDGVHEAVLRWQVFDKPRQITSLKELSETAFKSSGPFEILFDESQRGMFFYCCMCWSNTRSVEGDYSRIENATIP
jgi:hypothetical protein